MALSRFQIENEDYLDELLQYYASKNTKRVITSSFKVFEQFLHNSKKRIEDKLAAKITPIFPNCSNITININNNNNIYNDSNLSTMYILVCGLVGLLQIY